MPSMKQPPSSPWLSFALASVVALSVTLLKDLRGLDAAHPRVYGAFWESGHAAAHGLNPFGVYPLVPPQTATAVLDINLNPPALLPAFDLLARVSPAAVIPWVVVQALAFIGGAALLLACRRGPVPPWMPFLLVLAPQVSDSIFIAQDYGFLYLLALAGWLCLRARRGVLAGLAIGLFVAAKPNFGVWPLFLLLTGAWRCALTAGVTAAAPAILPALLYGPQVYTQWLAVAVADQHWQIANDVSLVAYATRLGMAGAGKAVAALLVVFSTILVWFRRPPALLASALALAVGILASPVSWADYLVFLFPAMVDGQLGRWGLAGVIIACAGTAFLPVSITAAGMMYLCGFCTILAVIVVQVIRLAPAARQLPGAGACLDGQGSVPHGLKP